MRPCPQAGLRRRARHHRVDDSLDINAALQANAVNHAPRCQRLSGAGPKEPATARLREKTEVATHVEAEDRTPKGPVPAPPSTVPIHPRCRT